MHEQSLKTKEVYSRQQASPKPSFETCTRGTSAADRHEFPQSASQSHAFRPAISYYPHTAKQFVANSRGAHRLWRASYSPEDFRRCDGLGNPAASSLVNPRAEALLGLPIRQLSLSPPLGLKSFRIPQTVQQTPSTSSYTTQPLQAFTKARTRLNPKS